MGTRNTFRYFVRSHFLSVFTICLARAAASTRSRKNKQRTKQNEKKPCRRFCPTTCKANRRQQTVADATLPDRTAANGGLGWGPAPSKGNTRHVEQPLLLFSFRFDSGSLLLVLARAREFIRERPRRPHDELKRVGCES